MDSFQQITDGLVDWLYVFIPNLAKALLIFIGGLYAAGKVKRLVLRTGRRLHWDSVLSEYLASACRYILATVIAISALNIAGFPVSSLLAAVGISGIIIGLGMRAQIANYFAGVMMLAAKPFREGDLIEFGPPPQIGRVHRLCMTYTSLDTPDNVRIIVPNAVLWRNRIYNFSTHGHRAIRIPISMPYDVNVQWVQDVALDVISRHDAVLSDPAPTFTMSDVTPEEQRAQLVAWSDVESMNIFGDVIVEMRKEFEIAQLPVKVPGKDVDLKREE